jgi:hypothetical protein
VESDEQAEALLRELGVAPAETPLLLGGPLALRNPTNGEVAEALNLRPARAPTRVADVLIVGAGPAELGAAVYAASEASARYSSIRRRSAARPARRQGSRTTSASRPGYPASSSLNVPRSRPSAL